MTHASPDVPSAEAQRRHLEQTVRAPMSGPVDLVYSSFGDDAIIRTSGPQRLENSKAWPMQGQRCRSGCRAKDHRSYAECLRAAGTRVAYCDSVNGSDATTQKNWDKELDAYRSVRKEGIQPEGTTMSKIQHAVRESDRVGAAYGRDFNKATPYEED